MKEKSYNILKYILCFTIIMTIALTLISKLSQNDIFFDLKTGESILKFGIDFKDHFSFIPNLTYIYHHWLYDLIVYFIHSFSGFKGLFIFFLVIYTLLGVVVFLINNKRSKNKFISLLTTFITMYLMMGFCSNRVQTITYVLFFLEIYNLEELYTKGNIKNLVYLILISILIANLHMPMWILTVVFAIPYLFEYLINNIFTLIPKTREKVSMKITTESVKKLKIFGIAFLLLILCGLLTPLKLYPYIFFTKALGNNSFGFIIEMMPPTLISCFYCLVLVAIMLILCFFTNAKVKLRDLGLLMGVFLFSLMAGRNLAYLYLFYPTILVKIYFENFNLPKIKIKNNLLNKIIRCINKYAIVSVLIICFGVTYFTEFKMLDFKNFDYGVEISFPDKSVNYIKYNLDYKNIRLFNEFNYGSYLEYYDIPVFIDSRAEVYIKEFNGGQDIMTDFYRISNYNEYKSVFEKYNFDYALVYTDSEIYNYLKADPEFDIVFTESDKQDFRYTLFQKILAIDLM